jgi:hypothetical protein
MFESGFEQTYGVEDVDEELVRKFNAEISLRNTLVVCDCLKTQDTHP